MGKRFIRAALLFIGLLILAAIIWSALLRTGMSDNTLLGVLSAVLLLPVVIAVSYLFLWQSIRKRDWRGVVVRLLLVLFGGVLLIIVTPFVYVGVVIIVGLFVTIGGGYLLEPMFRIDNSPHPVDPNAVKDFMVSRAQENNRLN